MSSTKGGVEFLNDFGFYECDVLAGPAFRVEVTITFDPSAS
ncbi:MAG TPA: hypothetical protein VGL11_02920 [Candidatus Binatia bacterium]|jgi:hypothetical protein